MDSRTIDRSIIPYTGVQARAGYRLFYTVSGNGKFPHDMLRHDGATAAAWNLPAGERVIRKVEVQSALQCTPERWRSFGWSVHDDIVERKAPVSVSINY
jgi:hypothetical protein